MDAIHFAILMKAWHDKVIRAKKEGRCVDTYQMIVDIDRIIADGFDRAPIMVENQKGGTA